MPQAIAAAIPYLIVAGATAYSASETHQANKAAKSRASAADTAAQKAAKDILSAQETAASQAKAAISSRRRRMTQTIYTDPLGIAPMAETARKTLTGQ